MTRLAVTASLLIAAASFASPAADEHLLMGARHFREGRFNEALVEFKAARKLGAGGEAGWYVAAALVKLDRAEEALEAFKDAEAEAPAAGDALLRYYQALACYQAKLYLCSDRLLASVSERGGPRITEQTSKLRAQLAQLFRVEPSNGTIDWYHARGQEAWESGRLAAAVAYYEEAVGLARRRRDCHRCDEASEALRQLTRADPRKLR